MINISIIIPSYNTSQYIERCISSLCSQTYEGALELIFVDDCSSDETVRVIENSLKKYSFQGAYKIITHAENMGVAAARVTGISNATGEYILFCDSDDWMDERMCELMYTEAMAYTADLVICDYRNVYENYSSIKTGNYDNDFLKGLLLCKCTGSLSNKLIRRQLLQNSDFIYPMASFSEDYVYSIQLAIMAKQIRYILNPLYNYCHRQGSLVTSKDVSAITRRLQENQENHKLVQKILQKYHLLERYYEESLVLKLRVKNLILSYLPLKGYYSLWKNTYPEMTIEIFKSQYITLKSKAYYFLTLLGLYPLIKKIRS